MTLSGFFFLCLLGGLIWAVISLILAGGFAGDSATDVHTEGGGIDHGDVSGEITFSPMSPTVIAVFITAFGAGGIVATEGLEWGALAAMGLACGSGLLIAGLVYEVLSAVYKRTQGSSEAVASDFIGITAEVLTPIPADGTGEVAYVIKGTRYTGSARSVGGEAIAKNRLVEIVRVAGSTVYVKMLPDDSQDEKE
jgi:membrane protein implicated in regulation of membrane protease activity